MNAPKLTRNASLIAALAVVSACGTSTPLAMSPARSLANPATSSGGSLLYADGYSDTSGPQTFILSYPEGQVVGSIPGGAQGMCSDTNGNVYLLYRNAAIEYAHGGTSPIRTLRIPGAETVGCAVDPITNDVAVTFSCPPCDYQDLAIFPSGSGTPTRYSAPLAYKCTYDNQGNLFLAGGVDSEISELPYGSQNFTIISINKEIDEPGQVQWDGKYVTLQTLRSPMRIYRIQISGSTGTVVSETKINRYMHSTGYSWISPSDGTVVVPFSAHSDVPNTLGIWRYPRGRSIKSIKNIGSGEVRFGSVTVSVAPSR